MDLKQKIKDIKNSVVAIGTLTGDQLNILGSGFCVQDDKHIMTAAHLIQNFSPEQLNNLGCMAVSADSEDLILKYTWFSVEVVSKSPENDMAILKLKTNAQKNLLKPLETSFSESIAEGQDVYFIGFPYAANLIKDGFGVSLIVNKAIISSVKRKGQKPNPLDWFIVDAISNPGNSGCPLIDLESNKVIGIMSISFRIPSQVNPALDIREPMHIAGAKPIFLGQEMLKNIK